MSQQQSTAEVKYIYNTGNIKNVRTFTSASLTWLKVKILG